MNERTASPPTASPSRGKGSQGKRTHGDTTGAAPEAAGLGAYAPASHRRRDATQTRLMHIAGFSPAARQRRLERTAAWMGAHGWHLADYADEARSAIFERERHDGGLSLLHPTRWVPVPDWWRPAGWLAALAGDPRLAILALVVVLSACVGALYAVAPPDLSLPDSPWRAEMEQAAAQQDPENVFYVDASALNVRAAPSTDAQVVGVLYRNDKVRVEEVNGGWARLAPPDEGYTANRFLQAEPLR